MRKSINNCHQSKQRIDLAIVFGSRTTLAKHILSAKWSRQHNLLLVARDQRETEYLASSFPAAGVLSCWLPKNEWKWPKTCGCVKIFLCAFGLIHPATPDWHTHCETMRRDIKVLVGILQKYQAQVIKLVFVSSVLALVPKPGRTYYAGWKCLAEAVISRLANHDKVSLSVLYPGRLVSRKTILNPLSFCHTTYDRFARRLTRIADSSVKHRKIVGLDARLVLILRGIKLFIHAIFK